MREVSTGNGREGRLDLSRWARSGSCRRVGSEVRPWLDGPERSGDEDVERLEGSGGLFFFGGDGRRGLRDVMLQVYGEADVVNMRQ